MLKAGTKVKKLEGSAYERITAKVVTEYHTDFTDTDTDNDNDFRSLDQKLYLSPSGQFFLATSGGPWLDIYRRIGNRGVGVTTIEMLSLDEVQWFIKEKGTPEQYAAFLQMLE